MSIQTYQIDVASVVSEIAHPSGKKPAPSWQEHVFTAASLKEKKFEPIAYVVPRLFPEGLTILAGRPKVGQIVVGARCWARDCWRSLCPGRH